MPLIHVTLIAGYSDRLKQRLCQALSRATRSVIAAPPEATIVTIQDVPPAGYLRGTTPPTPAMEEEPPESLVHRFLHALAERDIVTASACLDPELEMVFPGERRFKSLEDLVGWSTDRYRWVKKQIDHMDVVGGDEGTIVYCFGTLYGEWPDGTAFDGIRFIDRFIVRDGQIISQDVWNDLAESMMDRRSGAGSAHG